MTILSATQQYSATKPESMAMTFYEMTRPEARKLGFFDGLVAKLTAGLHTVQYSKMLQALSALNEEQLDAIGIKRSDIPAHAHKCIFGE